MGLLNSGPKMRGVKFSQSGRRDAGRETKRPLSLSASEETLTAKGQKVEKFGTEAH